MIECQSCGTKNIDGSQYCDECGSAIAKGQSSSTDRELQSVKTHITEQPVFQAANVTSVGISPIVEELKEHTAISSERHKSDTESPRASLVIDRGEALGTEFFLTNDESYIGRWDADNGIFPDVDLDAYDTEAKVSRRHSRIVFNNGIYSIEDLGSTNGTYINRGRRLIPGNSHVLKDGDEVIVGKIFLRFNVNS